MKMRFLPILLVSCLLASGCAVSLSEMKKSSRPEYSSAWQRVANSQAGLSKLKALRAAPVKVNEEAEEKYRQTYLEDEGNAEFQRDFENALKQDKLSAREADRLQRRLEENIRRNLEQADGKRKRPAGYEQWLREQYAMQQQNLNARILELLRIEPCVDLARGSKARLAIVELGDGVQTIRLEERKKWTAFFASQGFESEPVFIPEYLVGPDVSASSIRTAAARLGADAVLCYATTSKRDASPFGESMAVLAYSKCMLIDTRTEYLYFNAEGEGEDRVVTAPLLLDFEGFARKVEKASLHGLLDEITLELERLRNQND